MEGMRLIVLDRPGLGLSSAYKSPSPTYADFATFFRGFCKALGLGGAGKCDTASRGKGRFASGIGLRCTGHHTAITDAEGSGGEERTARSDATVVRKTCKEDAGSADGTSMHDDGSAGGACAGRTGADSAGFERNPDSADIIRINNSSHGHKCSGGGKPGCSSSEWGRTAAGGST